MRTLKKSMALLLSVLMLFSVISITASATEDTVEVTVKSQQGLFGDVTKTYKKGDTIEMTIFWQSDDLLRNGEFYTYLNSNGLLVTAEELNSKISGEMTNITEDCQKKYGEVSVNFSVVNGMDYTTTDTIVKYQIKVLDTASATETLTLNCREAFGVPAGNLAEEIYYCANGVANESNIDAYALSVTLSDNTPATTPTSDTQETDPSSTESVPTSSNTGDTTTTEPSESGTVDIGTIPTQEPSTSVVPTGTTPNLPTQGGDNTEPTENTQSTSSIIIPTDNTNPTTEPTTAATTPKAGAVAPGADLSVANNAILKQKGDADLKGSQFGALSARQKKTTKNSITITWNKVKGAKKYVIYGAACGTKYKKLKTVTGKTFTQKKLKKGTYYKYLIVAVNANDKVVSTSKTLHLSTTGNKKKANPTAVTVKSTKVTIKGKKTFNLKANFKKAKGTTVKKHRAIKYECSNTKVATVSAKGVIKGKKAGTCYVYAYAQNGLYKKIKVTVK